MIDADFGAAVQLKAFETFKVPVRAKLTPVGPGATSNIAFEEVTPLSDC